MITLRPSSARGRTQIGWLDSFHSFSFGEYHDRANTAFKSLRVINEDFVAAKAGFPTHPHRDMEIITVVLAGRLAHKDSLGSVRTISPGEVQVMSAGTGLTHSEFNPDDAPVHLLQIWIMPDRKGHTPAYDQKEFPLADRRGKLVPLAAGDARSGALKINQDAVLMGAILDPRSTVAHSLAAGRHAWVQVARGSVEVNGTALEAGDAVAISDEREVRITGITESEVLIFDLA